MIVAAFMFPHLRLLLTIKVMSDFSASLRL